MTKAVRLRIHVSEPFDFERENESADLFGTTCDHSGNAEEWEVDLEGWFTFNESHYDMVLIAPRYVGETLHKVHDAILGVPVRIAHRTPEGWHFAMTGMLSIPFESRQDKDDIQNKEDDNAQSPGDEGEGLI